MELPNQIQLMELPDEIKLNIFSQLSKIDLAKLARVSEENKIFAAEQELWLNLLFNDFYLTKASAQEIFSKKKFTHYKDLYKHCCEYELNEFQEKAVEKLKNQGLTVEHLKGRDWFNDENYVVALIYLVDEKNINVNVAIEMLANLTVYQASLLAEGYSKEDVLKLNKYQANALMDLKALGITIQHMQACDWFKEFEHLKALTYLVHDKQMSVESALQEIAFANFRQLQCIAIGFAWKEIENIYADEQLFALIMFKNKNLNLFSFVTLDWIDSDNRASALFKLVFEQHMDINTAIEKLSAVPKESLYKVMQGATIEEAIHLNEIQIETLHKLADKGLTLECLKDCIWFDSFSHQKALLYLVEEKQTEAIAALAELKLLNRSQLRLIPLGYSGEEILRLSNIYHVMAILDLHQAGLTIKQIKDCNWFNSEQQVYKLAELIEVDNMDINSALTKLYQLTVENTHSKMEENQVGIQSISFRK